MPGIASPNVGSRYLATEILASVEHPDSRAKEYRKLAISTYRTLAGSILSRAPVVTKQQTPFETSFYEYQRHISSRLSSPFPVDFYFQKGSPAAKRWQAGQDARNRSTNLTKIDEGINRTSQTIEDGTRTLLDEEDAIANVTTERETEADRTNDLHSLNRKLDRTLYLLIQKRRDVNLWQFPQGPVGSGEALHEVCNL